MSVFPVVAGLLLAFAMAFILVPLTRTRRASSAVTRDGVNVSVYRDQLRELEAELAAGAITHERHDEAVREIERRLLEDTAGGAAVPARKAGAGRAALVVGMGVPFLAATLYFAVGTPRALLQENVTAAPEGAAHGDAERQVEAMIERLAARLQAEPANAQGWAMLGRSYAVLGRFAEAAEAYRRLVLLVPEEAQVLADYADVLAMVNGRSLDGEPAKLIAKALALEPTNVKALALAGSAAFAAGDYSGAIGYWEKLVKVAPAGSELAESTRGSIDEARSRMAGSAPSGTANSAAASAVGAGAPAKAPPAARAVPASVSGVVEIAPALAGKVAPTDTLFVFARAAEGPRMPVAILRAQAKDLPLRFTLDDRSSIMGGSKLSDHAQVIVGARVSRTGSATPQPGDLQAYSAPVAPGATGVHIVLTER
jgi:cytochrome c-type biogenesis protein CcmH